jgi:hypothetical protein
MHFLRTTLSLLSVVAIAGCRSETAVSGPSGWAPLFAMSDGSQAGGNPDFFFLPPIASNLTRHPNWESSEFNPGLIPMVESCRLVGAACNGQLLVPTPATVAGEHYQLDWKMPRDRAAKYRITVKVGTVTLGFVDVNGTNGSTLPIKFRIESGALCDPPGTKPCGSTSIAFDAGGSVTIRTDPTAPPSGVNIPPQGVGAQQNILVTVTLQRCGAGLRERGLVDLPTFGSCVTVTTTPALEDPLSVPATVFVCDMTPVELAGIVSEAQEDRITLHRYDGEVVQALPHVPAPCSGTTASAGDRVEAALRHLVRGEFGAAGRHVLGLLSPRPLQALDVGGGGQTDFFSDFQFALPAKLEIVSGNHQTTLPGSTLPDQATVRVTDLGGEPVAGTRVSFAPAGGGAVSAATVTTGSNGLAAVSWTLATAYGANTLVASAKGTAGDDLNGPRPGVDPFQPVQPPFDPPNGPPVPVTLLTGSVTFEATGAGLSDGFEMESGWSSNGFWNRSTLTTSPTPISNSAYPSWVNLAPGDDSNGKLPSPFLGGWVFWYGEPEDGNYIGTPQTGQSALSGGTSTAPNSGSLTSPEFLVPSGGPVSLRFRTWFEIESVDADRFDLMRVVVYDVDANATTELGLLNPVTDPNGAPPTPFTSGGLNAPPVWVEVTHPLDAFAGKRVQLSFRFETGDVLYNGFRGWIVDEVRVELDPPSAVAAMAAPGAVTRGLTRPGPAAVRR